MAEIFRANPPTAHLSAISKAHRSSLHVPPGAVCRESLGQTVYQITVQSKTTVHRLILHVVPSVKFIKLFLRWLLVFCLIVTVRISGGLSAIFQLRRVLNVLVEKPADFNFH
jgi:hypothetical protein